MARDQRFSTAVETALREHTAKFRWHVLRRHVEDGTPLTQLAGLEGIGVRTLQRWLAAYRRDGVAGLLPVVPKRARHTHPELQTLRSEEHTSELQSRGQLVCRLLLEKKKRYSFTT